MTDKLPFELIDKLYEKQDITLKECHELLKNCDKKEVREYLFAKSAEIRREVYEDKIYIRGLIEFSNYCKNDCYYCGIRRSNKDVNRYRLTKEEIMSCCENGHKLGFRTFVLQGGEDPFFTDEILCDIISEIKMKYPDSAVTLSVGERDYESYKALFHAGADRFLLRHETINCEHYSKLHPETMSLDNRVKCLSNLKEIGFQVGTGFMVGSPYQTLLNIAEDIIFIKNFKPHMIGIGPYITHKNTPFKDFESGSVDLTTFVIGILRLTNKNALIPATTALETLSKKGREMGILAGANVIMPNLSPLRTRGKYNLYDNKPETDPKLEKTLEILKKKMQKIGYQIVSDRGDFKNI